MATFRHCNPTKICKLVKKTMRTGVIMEDRRPMAWRWWNSVLYVKTVKNAMVWCIIGFGGEMHRGSFDHGL